MSNIEASEHIYGLKQFMAGCSKLSVRGSVGRTGVCRLLTWSLHDVMFVREFTLSVKWILVFWCCADLCVTDLFNSDSALC